MDDPVDQEPSMNREDIRPMKRDFVRSGQFLVSVFYGDPGDHHVVYAPRALAREEMEHRSMIVSGRWRMVAAPEGVALFDDWAAGVPTTQRPGLPAAGQYVLECVEPTLYLCVQRGGRESKFNYRYVVDYEGEFTIPLNGIFAMGAGSVRTRRGVFSGIQVLRAAARDETVQTEAPVRGILATL
jgi:hypothetical protein